MHLASCLPDIFPRKGLENTAMNVLEVASLPGSVQICRGSSGSRWHGSWTAWRWRYFGKQAEWSLSYLHPSIRLHGWSSSAWWRCSCHFLPCLKGRQKQCYSVDRLNTHPSHTCSPAIVYKTPIQSRSLVQHTHHFVVSIGYKQNNFCQIHAETEERSSTTCICRTCPYKNITRNKCARETSLAFKSLCVCVCVSTLQRDFEHTNKKYLN